MPSVASSPMGIYISIPFCRAKCSYCNFASGVFGSDRMEPYLDRLITEIRGARRKAQKSSLLLAENLDSIYFGGGTPSILCIQQMSGIMEVLHEEFSFVSGTEITLECAPGQLSDDLLETLPGFGFTRVSLGVQSFVDQEAAAVGRSHSREVVLWEIARLRHAGLEDINVDLIAGLPLQTPNSWRRSLEEAIATGVPHLSVYMLDVDEDSRLGKEMLTGGTRYGVNQVPDDQMIADMYSDACEQFNAAGIAQYEISNFARFGKESRHNIKYWTRQPYLGFGLDAHSFLYTNDGNGVRIGTTDDMTAYLDRGAQETTVRVSPAQAIEEAWFLGLRLSQGVSLIGMEREIGPAAMGAFRPVLSQCEREGLIERNAGYARLTQHGRLFANEVFARFIGVYEPDTLPADVFERVS